MSFVRTHAVTAVNSMQSVSISSSAQAVKLFVGWPLGVDFWSFWGALLSPLAWIQFTLHKLFVAMGKEHLSGQSSLTMKQKEQIAIYFTTTHGCIRKKATVALCHSSTGHDNSRGGTGIMQSALRHGDTPTDGPGQIQGKLSSVSFGKRVNRTQHNAGIQRNPMVACYWWYTRNT